LCIFVALLWLLVHYTTQRRHAQSLARDDEKMLSDFCKQPTGWKAA